MYEELYDIPNFSKWKNIDKINLGWSEDSKYYIEDEEDNKYLLRISDGSTYDKKRKEFEIIKRFNSLDFVMSRALDFGRCNNNENVYMLLTWVEGASFEEIIGDYSEKEQYEIGLKAGRILKELHSLKVEKEDIPNINKQEKMLIKLDKYINSTVRIKDDQAAIDFIQNNIHRINSQPPVYRHGDFHAGNLILDSHGEVGVIDFNRWECGDMYEEFYKIQSFGLEVSVPFSIGQIHGYFGGEPDNEFWEILTVYVAYASLYSIAWAEKFGQDEVEGMIRRCMAAFEDYDNFKAVVPAWYEKNCRL